MNVVGNVSVQTRVPIRICPTPSLDIDAEVVTFSGIPSGAEHVGILVGHPATGCIVRIHSECLTGDVFGSARCDCGAQLLEALEILMNEGGVLIYMRQEGRGIGLYSKLQAYLVQDSGMDTFAANEALGYAADERTYEESAAMLLALGLGSVRLHTNNPDKVDALRRHGIGVESVQPTKVHYTLENRSYLRAKALIAGHTIRLDEGLR